MVGRRLTLLALLIFVGCAHEPTEAERRVQIFDELPKTPQYVRMASLGKCKCGPGYGSRRPDDYCANQFRRQAASIDADIVVIDDMKINASRSGDKFVYSATAYRLRERAEEVPTGNENISDPHPASSQPIIDDPEKESSQSEH